MISLGFQEYRFEESIRKADFLQGNISRKRSGNDSEETEMVQKVISCPSLFGIRREPRPVT